MKMITYENYVTASGKYPERLKHKELTEEIKKNIEVLLAKVNALLVELGISSVKVSSGFRPSDVNAGIPNAAKRSAHMTGNAVDMEDLDGSLDEKISLKPALLRKYGLFQEHPSKTGSWAHLDCVARSDRPSRQFMP